MFTAFRWGQLLLAASLLVTGSTSPAMADEKAGADKTAGDQKVFEVLRDIINRGADLYNAPNNDHAGCYRLFQGALMTVRPQLDPDLQKVIDAGLTNAEKFEFPSQRAHALRKTLDEVRAKIKAQVAKAPADQKPAQPIPPAPPASLWDRLGGEPKVKAVVDDFVALAGKDPKVDISRGGKIKITDERIADVKKKLIAYLSQATGGPIKYTGKDMKDAHKGMGITSSEFDASVADLRKALEKNGAKAEEVEELIKVVNASRKDIVQPALAAETKPAQIKTPEAPKLETKPETPTPEKKTGKVKASITLDGKPLAENEIQFIPKGKSANETVTGMTDSDGVCRLDKVAPGEYVVVIMPCEPPKTIPVIYTEADRSPLIAVVKEGNNAVSLNLKSAGEDKKSTEPPVTQDDF